MNNDPFKKQEVKLFNYNPVDIEKRKIENINNQMYKLHGGTEYSNNYHKPSYSDVLPKEKSYKDELPREQHYSDCNLKRQNPYDRNNYGNMNGNH